jgi:NAD(P)-dependent dehydrogenase (short-subunit alcohol dehydrogenase family)
MRCAWPGLSSWADMHKLATAPRISSASTSARTLPAAKTALNALTVAMAIELENEGIKVNAVSPGFTKTNLRA